MSETVLVIDHPVSQTEARRQVQRLLQSVRQKGGRWTARWTRKDRLVFETDWNGSRIQGEVLLKTGSVEVSLKLPWALQVLGGQIRHAIEETALQVLGNS